MALFDINGCDDFNTVQANRHFTGFSGTITATGGRNNTGRYVTSSASHYASRTVTNQATMSAGLAIKLDAVAGASCAVLGFADGTTNQVVLLLEPGTNRLQVRRGGIAGTVLGTSTAALSTGVWYHIEMKATIDAAAGVIVVNLNSTAVLNLTAQNTKVTANSYSNVIVFNNDVAAGSSGFSTGASYDDLYIDDAGTFAGDCRVETLLPESNGTTNQWFANAGLNYQCVDENPADDDTFFVHTTLVPAIDLYNYPVLATTAGAIKGIAVVGVLRNDAAGTTTVQLAVKPPSASTFFGASQVVGSTTYNGYRQIWETNPNTSLAWAISDINFGEFGVKRTV